MGTQLLFFSDLFAPRERRISRTFLADDCFSHTLAKKRHRLNSSFSSRWRRAHVFFFPCARCFFETNDPRDFFSYSCEGHQHIATATIEKNKNNNTRQAMSHIDERRKIYVAGTPVDPSTLRSDAGLQSAREHGYRGQICKDDQCKLPRCNFLHSLVVHQTQSTAPVRSGGKQGFGRAGVPVAARLPQERRPPQKK